MAKSQSQQPINVEPNQLEFNGPFTKEVTVNMTIHNNSSAPIGFKIKTSAPPTQFIVIPNMDLIQPHTRLPVSVKLQPMDEAAMCQRHKYAFLIQYMYLPDTARANNLDKVMRSADKSNILKHELKCVFTDEEYQTVCQSIQTPDAKVVYLETQVSDLKEKYKRLLMEHTENGEMINTKQEEIQRLTNRLKALQEENTKLKTAPDASLQFVDITLTGNKTVLALENEKAEKEKAQNQVKTLLEKVNDLERQLSAQWNSKVALSSKLSTRYKELENQLKAEREANQSLQKQVHNLEAKLLSVHDRANHTPHHHDGKLALADSITDSSEGPPPTISRQSSALLTINGPNGVLPAYDQEQFGRVIKQYYSAPSPPDTMQQSDHKPSFNEAVPDTEDTRALSNSLSSDSPNNLRNHQQLLRPCSPYNMCSSYNKVGLRS